VRVARVLIGAGLAAVAAAGTYLAARDRVVGANGAPLARPVPVTAGTVEEKAFPIYRVGLGTVQAYNTVTVKVRVDGEVQKIVFREGQDVREGDLLAQIDPRPYVALLEQAVAEKARDEALLGNAKLDLERLSTLTLKEVASRQSFDTKKALVAQYQAAIERDQAAIDNARVQLGYTPIATALIMAALLLIGAIAYVLLPVAPQNLVRRPNRERWMLECPRDEYLGRGSNRRRHGRGRVRRRPDEEIL